MKIFKINIRIWIIILLVLICIFARWILPYIIAVYIGYKIWKNISTFKETQQHIKGKKAIKLAGLCMFAVIFVIWFVPYVHNEVLTVMHGKEFKDKYNENTMLKADITLDSMKVIKYSDSEAKVYYVMGDNGIAEVYTFEKNQNNEWEAVVQDTIWSRSGSASETLWPYFWYIVYGGI